jgi:hypothetical protein
VGFSENPVLFILANVFFASDPRVFKKEAPRHQARRFYHG